MHVDVLGPLRLNDSAPILTLYRSASCGCFSPAEEYAEASLSLDDLVRLREPSMFLVRAAGDSMVDAGIYPGDVLIVDKARKAVSGDVIVARLGSEFVVKTLRIARDRRAALMPANKAYQPIVLGDAEQLEVWGVCTWNLHQLSRG